MRTFVSIQKLTFRNVHRTFAPIDLDNFPGICLNIIVSYHILQHTSTVEYSHLCYLTSQNVDIECYTHTIHFW